MTPVLLADPIVSSIPVVEDGSPVVDLRDHGVAVLSHPPRLPVGAHTRGRMPLGSLPDATTVTLLPHVHARVTLAQRLAAADANLPSGIRLLVVEGLRPLAAQVAIHDAYRCQVAAASPWLGPDEVDALASRFVSPPSIAPHVSGAAVDLTLTGPEGQLDLGTPIDATPEESQGACYFDATTISARARSNRSLLASVLAEVGLVNYPTEWWHWSFGDRYWAHATGSAVAVHGSL